MMRKWNKGSITIFTAISLMLVVALLLVLLEGARLKELQVIAHANTDSIIESVFAEYQRPLWEMYHILAFDSKETEQQSPFAQWEWYVKELSESNVAPNGSFIGSNYLSMGVTSVDFENYRLLTDGEGYEYLACVSSYMRNNWAAEAQKTLCKQYDSLKTLQFGEDYDSSAISAADDAIRAAKEEEAKKKAEEEAKRKAAEEEAKRKAAEEEARRTAQEEAKRLAEQEAQKSAQKEKSQKKKDKKKKKIKTVTAANKDQTITFVEQNKATAKEENGQMADNPLVVVKELWTKGLLPLLVENPDTLSQNKIDLKDIPSRRNMRKGTSEEAIRLDATDHVLFSYYVLSHFSSYANMSGSSPLAYEMEYMLCGQADDIENLKGTVRRLLAIREAANLLYLEKDAAKQQLALQLATTLAGASANPAFIYIAKVGIITAWALAESLLDIRTLLSGGRIAVVKSREQWTTDLLHLGSAFSSFGKAVDCSNGLSYQTYLGFLLCLNEKKTCHRCMDIQELAVRSKEGYENFRMDHMVTRVQLSIEYRGKSIFVGIAGISSKFKNKYNISTSTTYAYRRAGV